VQSSLLQINQIVGNIVLNRVNALDEIERPLLLLIKKLYDFENFKLTKKI
jgi:hypothetical protein